MTTTSATCRCRCQCGEWSGEPCQWTGHASDMVVVEWMPRCRRASHEAAGNAGAWPTNGSVRIAVEESCAEAMIAHDGEWCRVVSYDEADAAKLAAITDQNTLLCDATAEQWGRFERAASVAGHASGHSAANDGDLWDETVADAIALAGDREECE